MANKGDGYPKDFKSDCTHYANGSLSINEIGSSSKYKK